LSLIESASIAGGFDPGRNPRSLMSQWFYQDAQGVRIGPLTNTAFRILRESGTVGDTTSVWRTGWEGWTTYADIWLHGNPPEQDRSILPPPAGEPSLGSTAPVTLTGDPASAATSSEISPPLRLEYPFKEPEFREIKHAKCALCHHEWPEHLLFGSPRLFVCAPCLKQHEDKRKERQRLRDRRPGIHTGVTNWVIKLLLIGLAMAAVLIVFFHFLQGASK
jgi:hypothetical protein